MFQEYSFRSLLPLFTLNDDKIYYIGFCITNDDPHKSRMESRPEQCTCPIISTSTSTSQDRWLTL